MNLKNIRSFYLKLRKAYRERQINFYFLGFFIFLALTSFFLFFFFPSTPPNKIYREGVLEDISVLTPYFTSNETEKTLANIIFPSLIELESGKITSKLLSNFNFDQEKKEIFITLKDNLFWADGEKITSEDVRFGLEFAKKFSSGEINKVLNRFSFKIINEKQGVFTVELSHPYALYFLKYIKPLPTKIFSKYSPDFKNLELARYGSGPFVFDHLSQDPQKKVVLIRNKYYKDRVFLERLEFIVFANQNEALQALILKNIDALSGLTYTTLPKEVERRVNIYYLVLPRVIGLFFNQAEVKSQKIVDYLEKNKVREQILKEIFGGKGEISEGLFSPKVRQLLGLKNLASLKPEQEINLTPEDKNFEILVPSSFFYPDIARFLRDKYGFQFKLIKNEEVLEIIKNKNYSALLYGINYNFPPQLSYFFSQAGLNLNGTQNQLLEKKFFELSQGEPSDPLAFNGDLEAEILKSKANYFMVNPYYLYLLSKNFAGYDTYFISEINERLLKIQNIYQK